MRRDRAKPELQLPERAPGPSARRRMTLVVVLLSLAALGLLAQAVKLQVVDKSFYQAQGNARFLREVPIPVSRGSIFDRNGVPLAVSTPVESIWANPQELLDHTDQMPALARALGIAPDDLEQYLEQRANREFVYLKRRMSPEAAQAVLDLKVPGVNEQREFRRYYPLGAVTAHVLGFTNIDDHGQEGLERAYDQWLSGAAGSKRVIRDRLGHTVETVDMVRAPKPGHDLTLSIDRRIQYLAYRQLDETVKKFKASSASMVIMDPRTGEVLAMVNLPSYNPNAVGNSDPSQRRNRAVTDVVEPGSTAKAFTVAAALESGKWTPSTKIDTSPGWIQLYGHTIKDDEDNGVLDVTGVITRSSNIGAAKMALSLSPDAMYKVFRDFGFGASTGSGFPGESSGLLPIGGDWRPIRQATIGYGYGFSVTALQLAQAYCALADGGQLRAPSFVKGQDNAPKQVLSPEVAQEVVNMLKTVVEPGGTAYRTAAIANYTVAGKTGTSHIAEAGGYSNSNYNSLFAGMVPASNPRLVGVVIVRGAQGGYFGTTVAAPVFSSVMKGALRLLDIPPDNVPQLYASRGGAAAMQGGRSRQEGAR
ncbi:peptidoglycan D,D-transpeptidase FtsI family protein [Oleiagrimonas soli]|uniref:Peptidoglycan D,D-transpeptidase FtsI n=1 Tax=Oleiagrimonas soli TaxID=1543381 RepID=A0A841KTY8_9GAMM|nr:penicillin-binding protein 2 [Oleiagrimonas soli]MBB6185408.1 cell division protein FtsI (penicillin-binding protein 3) [Oleiagrimonas soli]